MAGSAAKYGIMTPGVSLSDMRKSNWQIGLTVEDMAATVAAADRLGYDHCHCCDHVGIPAEEQERRGVRYYEPLATFGYLAAFTKRIRMATSVLVLAYHHPLELAKRYGTLDRFCNGRLVLGVGVGSLKKEFDLLGLGGVEFTERGVRGDDAIRAIRASMGKREPAYRGPYYDFGGFVIDPCAVQENMPIWVGGRSARSLRRAVELGDGWMPFGLQVDQLATFIAQAREQPSWEARKAPLELVLKHEGELDPMGEPGKAAEGIRKLFEAGATKALLSFVSNSRDHYIEQLEALAELNVD